MCRAFRNADVEIGQRAVLIESSMFRTNSQLKAIQQMHEDLDEDFKAMQTRLYNTFISKLKDVISRVERLVDKSTDESGTQVLSIKRGKYIFVKQHLDSAINGMERWQTRFDPTWKLVLLRSTGPTVDKVLNQHDQGDSTHKPAASSLNDMKTLRRMVKDGQSSGVSVFLPASHIEEVHMQPIPFSTTMVYKRGSSQRSYIVDTIDVDLRHLSKHREKMLARNVRSLAEKLHFLELSESLRIGMLQCKGFVKRSEGGFRFVFRQPERTKTDSPPRSLRAMFLAATEHSLTERMNLVKQLARAVSYVHSLGFVHKNIRPETIVGVWINGLSVDLESVFLMGFGHFRAEDGATSLLGDNKWERNLYRHPDRQGLHPEEEYVMEHDIYSLGVCLLEIGLWTSFVAYDAEENPSRGEILNAVEDSQSPTDLKSALVSMAREQLPSRMGDRYCSIVINCLTCLDEDNADFADEAQFQDESGILIGVKYIEKVSFNPQLRERKIDVPADNAWARRYRGIVLLIYHCYFSAPMLPRNDNDYRPRTKYHWTLLSLPHRRELIRYSDLDLRGSSPSRGCEPDA